MFREQKAALTDVLRGKFEKANAAVIAEYRGLTVEQVTKLRIALRSSDAEFRVAKNRLTRISLKSAGADRFAPLDKNLKGPLGIVFIYGDVALTAKNLLAFEKENDKFEVKSAVFDGKIANKDAIKAISDLPPKEVLLAQIVGALKSPHRGLVITISGVCRQLVQVINAIKDSKQG